MLDQCLPVDGDGRARAARPVVPDMQILEFRHGGVDIEKRPAAHVLCLPSPDNRYGVDAGYVPDLGACRRIRHWRQPCSGA